MKIWKCPNCKKERYYIEQLAMRVCKCCQVEMKINEVVDGRS